MDYSRFLTDVTKRREPTMLRDLFNLMVGGGEDWIFNIGGLPNESLFPLTKGEFTMPDGRKIIIDEEMMKECLQYGPSKGNPALLEEIRKLVKKYHDPPHPSEREYIVTEGVQDSLAKAFDMMINEGDYILAEEPCYSAILSLLRPFAPKFLTLETDEKGLKPESLRAALSRWSPEEMSKAEKGVPKFLYTNPNGNNPCGSTVPESRRREIYDICCEYSLLIIEDDSYYFLQYTPQEEVPPSFLRLDTEGRVLRLESFSKILGGGLRVGFAVGPKPIIRKLEIMKQTSTQHVCNLPQVLIIKLLKLWGEEGFAKHITICKEFYQNRRDQVLLLAEKHLKDLCEWNVPTGGLFLWFKVKNVPNVWEMIMEKAPTKKIIMVPGNCFMIDDSKPSPYVRVSFSHNPLEKIDEIFQRFAEMIREEIKHQNSTKG